MVCMCRWGTFRNLQPSPLGLCMSMVCYAVSTGFGEDIWENCSVPKHMMMSDAVSEILIVLRGWFLGTSNQTRADFVIYFDSMFTISELEMSYWNVFGVYLCVDYHLEWLPVINQFIIWSYKVHNRWCWVPTFCKLILYAFIIFLWKNEPAKGFLL